MMAEEPVVRGEIVDECGARFEVFLLPNDEDTLINVLKDCFAEWRHIRIGPCDSRRTVGDTSARRTGNHSRQWVRDGRLP